MAKPASLFLELATEYQNVLSCIIDTIKESEEDGHSISLMLYQNSIEDAARVTQRIKLLFAEFDKGEIFLERSRAIDAERGSAPSKERLIAYLDVLLEFIIHLNTFRL